MDWKHLAAAAGGALLLALAHYIRTGKPILFDPANRYPIFDMVRDVFRILIVFLTDHFLPPPAAPAGSEARTIPLRPCGDPDCEQCAHLRPPPAPPPAAP